MPPRSVPSPAASAGAAGTSPRRAPRQRFHVLTRVRRAVLLRRRPLAALLAVVAVLASVRAMAAPPAPTVPVVVAAADVAGGTTLAATDLAVAELPGGAVPAGASSDPAAVTGRVLAAPLRRGEPVTDVRLVSPGLLAGYPGTVAAPVRLADPDVAALLAVGDHVHLVATSPETGQARVVAEDVPVIAVPRPGESGDSGGTAGGLGGSGLPGDGGLVVVAVDETSALALAEAAATGVVSALVPGRVTSLPSTP